MEVIALHLVVSQEKSRNSASFEFKHVHISVSYAAAYFSISQHTKSCKTFHKVVYVGLQANEYVRMYVRLCIYVCMHKL